MYPYHEDITPSEGAMGGVGVVASNLSTTRTATHAHGPCQANMQPLHSGNACGEDFLLLASICILKQKAGASMSRSCCCAFIYPAAVRNPCCPLRFNPVFHPLVSWPSGNSTRRPRSQTWIIHVSCRLGASSPFHS